MNAPAAESRPFPPAAAPQDDSEHAAGLLKNLAHPERLQLSRLLRESERSLDEMTALTGLSVGTVSKHLSRMRRFGMVDFVRYHSVLLYRLTSEPARRVLDALYPPPAAKTPAGSLKEQGAAPIVRNRKRKT